VHIIVMHSCLPATFKTCNSLINYRNLESR